MSDVIPSPFVQPLEDTAYLLGLLVEITGQPADDVLGRFRREHGRLGTNVHDALDARGIEPYVWTDRLRDFYGSTDAFLFESIAWNRTPTKNAMRRWIAQFLADREAGAARVLVYGDGPGFDSFYFSSAGYRVSYFDLSPQDVRFARRMFSDFGLRVEVLDSPAALESESFDAVICLDVLEHAPEPRTEVALLTRALRKGGYLVVHAPFWYVHPDVGTHLRANLRFSGSRKHLYANLGLKPVDAQLFWNPIVLEKTAGGPVSRRVPWSSWLRIRLGGWLLASARLSRVPHRWTCALLKRADQSRLQQLMEQAAADIRRWEAASSGASQVARGGQTIAHGTTPHPDAMHDPPRSPPQVAPRHIPSRPSAT
jgi:SAM-dependent methyltransferase